MNIKNKQWIIDSSLTVWAYLFNKVKIKSQIVIPVNFINYNNSSNNMKFSAKIQLNKSILILNRDLNKNKNKI